MENGENALWHSHEHVMLRETLLHLKAREIRELLAIMYTGRGDWPPDEFWAQLESLHVDESQGIAVDHLIGKASLFEYLADGIEDLNRAGQI